LSNLGFGFGSRTGGSTNEHYIKGLLVTKLGTDTSRYGVDTVSPMGGNLYMDNTAGAQRLGIGTASPDSTLEVDGTESHKTIVASGAGFGAGNYVYQGSGTGIPACGTTGAAGAAYTASATVTGVGTSFSTSMIGDTITLPDGVQDTITAVASTTSMTVSGSRLECRGSYTILTNAFTVTGTASPIITIGENTTDTTQVLLQLDSFNTLADTATCSTTTNQGAMYYNTITNAIRSCINGGWEDLASTAALGLQLFGVVPDSGTSNQGDLAGVTGLTNGPCQVHIGGATTGVAWNACTAYSGGRKIIVTAGTATATNSGAGNFQHLCLTGANNQPALSTNAVGDFIQPTATAGYSNTAAFTSVNGYLTIGTAETAWTGATACSINANACQGSILTFIKPR
jgi:hypothetical protein